MLKQIKVPENFETKEGFSLLVSDIDKTEGYKNPLGFAISRNDVIEVLNKETGEYEDKIAQSSMPVVNFKKDGGENLGSAAIMHLALALEGVELDNSGSEAVYNITLGVVKIALGLFTAYISEAKKDDKTHLNIQMLLDLEYMIENQSDSMLSSVHGTKRDDISIVFIYEDKPVESVQAAYLKLHALSSGKAKLRSLNLDGAFGVMTNVAWCEVNNTIVPVSLDYLRYNERRLKLSGNYPIIRGNDKFPQYLDHIIPADNTRILDTNKVRMGAQLAAGTTVMPGASYINFNAGTLGPVMVEGRVSSSAKVGSGSDIGGGASILGVLSGTDGNPITIGENCLLGANSVCGIPLGDACIIDGGLAIFAGTKVKASYEDITLINEVNSGVNLDKLDFRADELQGLNGLHFRRDSQSGQVIVKRSTREVVLNSELH